MEQLFSSENVAVASLALLAIGFLKFILYYKAFNIPIVDYIDPSEIITLFADNIATATLVIFILALPYAKLINIPLASTDIFVRLETYFNLLAPIVFVSGVALIATIKILWKRPKIHNFELFRFVVLWPVIVFVIPVLVLEIKKLFEPQVTSSLIIILALSINFALLVIIATLNEIKKVKEFGYFQGVVIKFVNSEIVSTTEEYFIGKTKSFVFFYSPKSGVSTAYSTADLRSIRYS
jgi:hypothetical protein